MQNYVYPYTWIYGRCLLNVYVVLGPDVLSDVLFMSTCSTYILCKLGFGLDMI